MQDRTWFTGKEQVPVTVTDGRNWLVRYDREHEQIDEVTTRAYKGEHKIIEIKDVFFRYDRMACDVLHGLNLSVYEGEILAINGSNGCGKSTLLSLIAGAGIPYRGRIRIGKGKKVGLLPQDPKLLFTASTVRGELGIEKIATVRWRRIRPDRVVDIESRSFAD